MTRDHIEHKATAKDAGQEPAAHGDPMGTPAADEKVLWKGRPELALLSRHAFHTRKVGLYFAALIAIAVLIGHTNAAIVCAVLGVAATAILHGLAWLSVRSSLYIITDTRVIMRIGMAIETRINVPLKHVLSADLKKRGGGHGDISLQLGGERLLGYALLWPHVRPFRLARPEPMLRAVPEAQSVAAVLADACAAHVAIERSAADAPKAADVPASAPAMGTSEGVLEGATA